MRRKNSGQVRIGDGPPRVRARASSLKRDRGRGVTRRKRRSACRQRPRSGGRRGRHGHPGRLVQDHRRSTRRMTIRSRQHGHPAHCDRRPERRLRARYQRASR